LGDSRLNYRMRCIAKRVAADPSKSFPEALATEAELEGFYRFFGNDKVTKEKILEPHASATVQRLVGRSTVLVVHDNTEFRFKGEGREGLGRVTRGGNGFFGHVCLAVAVDETRDPLGVLDIDVWARNGESPSQLRKKDPKSYLAMRRAGVATEQDRWFQMVERAEARAAGAASLVHVMDSEADDYVLLWNLINAKRRFVLRLCYDRKLDAEATGSTPGEKALEFVSKAETLATRDVMLSRRNRPKAGSGANRTQPRSERLSSIAFSARSVVLVRPKHAARTASETLQVNIVAARETSAPEGETPIEWLLLTTEPIESKEDLLAVVDMYRARWLIEEYFKCLKTGCAFETRQLETSNTIFKALALFAPVAWALLRMRTLSRLPGNFPIAMALSPTQIKILKSETRLALRLNSSVLEGCLAVARLGGHIKNNGAPGWQVLGRGYTKLLTLEVGYKIAKRETSDR
jgi:hypothetical protein